MSRSALLGLGLLFATAFLAGCPANPPPIAPEPTSWNGSSSGNPIAVAATVDSRTLRSQAEEQRERINALLDVAERRELKEGGPPVLREMKESARQLDRIEKRLDEIDQSGMRAVERDNELELVSDQLRRLNTRVSLLADTMR